MDHSYSKLCFIIIWISFIAFTVAREVIIGGHKAELKKFSYHVALISHSTPFCNGAIITKELIVTAARCVVNDGGEIEKKRIFILGGTTDLRQVTAPAVLREVKKVYVPAHYLPFFITPVDDIAVLKLRDPLILSAKLGLTAVSLPSHVYENFDGIRAKVSGYGWSWINGDGVTGGRNDTDLRYADADVLVPGQYGCPPGRIHEKQICARVFHHDEKLRGTCTGDLGGPLVFDNTVLVGILSGVPYGCSEKNIAATYTRVTYYLNFIRNVKADKVTKNMNALIIMP